MSELGFNVPPITRSYGDGTSVLSLTRKTGKAGDRSCDPWIGSLALINHTTVASVNGNAALKRSLQIRRRTPTCSRVSDINGFTEMEIHIAT